MTTTDNIEKEKEKEKEENYLKTDNPIVLKKLIMMRDGKLESQREQMKKIVAENMEATSKLYRVQENLKAAGLDMNTLDKNDGIIRKFTLQEQREINMGVYNPRFRVPAIIIKNIYFDILRTGKSKEDEPQFVDLSFDSGSRNFNAFYLLSKADLEKEEAEIKDAEESKEVLNTENIPEILHETKNYYEKKNVIDSAFY